MYTNIRIYREDAASLAKIARPDIEFDAHFEAGAPKNTYLTLPAFWAELYMATPDGEQFFLRYNEFLETMPSLFERYRITLISVQLVRHNVQPTRAKAGRYEEKGGPTTTGSYREPVTATVESVSPKQATTGTPVFVQHIVVETDTLENLRKWHSGLVQGNKGYACIEPWE